MLSRLLVALRGDFWRDGAVVFAAGIFVNASNYVFHFYMTRHLMPASYGMLSSLLALGSVLSIPAGILTLVVVKYAAEFHAVDDLARLRTLCRRVALAGVCAALFVLAIFTVAGGAIASFLRTNDAVAIMIVGVVIATGLINPGLRGVLQGTQDFRALATALGIEALGKCALGVGCAAAGFGVRGALAGYVAGCFASVLYALVAISKYRRFEPAPLRIDLRRLAVSTGGIFLGTGALQAATFLDVILVKHYFSPDQAGVYSAVALAGKVVLFVVGFIPGIVLPKAAALYRRGHRTTPVLMQALGLTAGMSVLTLAVMFVAPHFVMRLFSGTQYLFGSSMLPLYATAMVFLAAASTIANYQIGLHRFHFVVPLTISFVFEFTAIAVYHHAIQDILYALVAGNAALMVSTLYVPARVRQASRLKTLPSSASG